MASTFLCSSPLFGQLFGLPNQERYTISDGLSNNSITDIQQDSFGFLWIATADGLNRFNGLDFTSHHPDPKDSTRIADSFIASIKPSPNGTLLLATQKGGLQYINFRRNAFSTLLPEALNAQFQNSTIQHGETLECDEDGQIWVGTRNGILQIIPGKEGKAPQKIIHQPERFCKALFIDSKKQLWAGTDNGLYQWNPIKGRFFPHEGLSLAISGEVRTINESPTKQLLVGAAKGLFHRDESGWRNIPLLKNGKPTNFRFVTSLVYDRMNRLWVGGQQGLAILNGETFSTKTTDQRILEANQLGNENISTLYIDLEDNLWIGTANNGLIRLFLSDDYFPVFRPNRIQGDGGTPVNTIRSIFEDRDGRIWLGSYGAGLYTFDRKTNSFKNPVSTGSTPSLLDGQQVSSIYRDQQGKMWVGTWGDGLIELLSEKQPARLIRRPLHGSNADFIPRMSEIQRIFEDEYDNLWIITNGGIAIRRPNSSDFEEVTRYFSLPYLSINSILEDRHGNWWIGTWNGLFIFDKAQVQQAKLGKPTKRTVPAANFPFNQGQENTLSNNRITSILQDSKDRIWIATYGGGINQWIPDYSSKNIPQSGRFKSFMQQDGLSNNIIYGMLEDNQGRIWLSSNNGLILFNPETANMQTFTTEDGLQSNQFYFGAYSQTRDGHFIFGGTNGFNIFDPMRFSTTAEAPDQIILTDLSIKGESVPIQTPFNDHVVLEESVSTASNMQLGPKDNNFLIRFVSPTMNHASKLRYAYRLDGFDDNWRITDHENRYAVYSNLGEGKYRFEVKASRDGQNWSAIRSLNVKVYPPWFRTWWAYLILAFIILGILLAISWASYRYSNLNHQLRLEQLERQKESEINDMRMWFFTYISHEFRTPLTLILSPVQELLSDLTLPAETRNKVQFVQRNSNRLLRLVNQILNFRKINSGKADVLVSEQDLIAFARNIFFGFSSMAEEQGIQYTFDSEESHLPLYFDGEKMEMILYNLLSNAFKFAPQKSTIKLKIESQEQLVQIKVIDTGPGIPLAEQERIFKPFERSALRPAEGSGIGLALVKEMVQLHHGQIDLDSRRGEGAVFTLTFQKGKAHFKSHQLQMENQSTDQANPEGSSMQSTRPKLPANLFPEWQGKSKPTILLAEDNIEIRQYLKQQFSDLFLVREASNGREALEISQKHWPDLIITDVMMPEMDGIALVRHLKRDHRTNHIPILILTAKTAENHILESYSEGILEYITKPVNVHLLKARVIAILRNIEQLKA
ncbi:MAG: two-component regulator propeller domain-containing protein, partial [Bacteroidota bacterium]